MLCEWKEGRSSPAEAGLSAPTSLCEAQETETRWGCSQTFSSHHFLHIGAEINAATSGKGLRASSSFVSLSELPCHGHTCFQSSWAKPRGFPPSSPSALPHCRHTSFCLPFSTSLHQRFPSSSAELLRSHSWQQELAKTKINSAPASPDEGTQGKPRSGRMSGSEVKSFKVMVEAKGLAGYERGDVFLG